MKRFALLIFAALMIASPCIGAERQVTLAWDHSPDQASLANYKLYYVADGEAEQSLLVSPNDTQITVTLYGDGTKCKAFTFRMSSIDTNGAEGVSSNSVQDGRPFKSQGVMAISK